MDDKIFVDETLVYWKTNNDFNANCTIEFFA